MESSYHGVTSPEIRLWKRNIENLLFKSNICGICLLENENLHHLNRVYHIEHGKKKSNLKDIIEVSFGCSVASLLPTNYICQACVTNILHSYLILQKIYMNHTIIEKYIDVLTQQTTINSETEQPMQKQLLLTIDNINSLNVPTTVTKKAIFLCKVNNLEHLETSEDESEYDTCMEYDTRCVEYECPYCGKQFPDYITFKEHYRLHNEAFFRCHKCGKRFKYFDGLIEHRARVHSDILTICDICQIILLSSESTDHELDHPGKYCCSKCQSNFKSQSTLEQHNSEMHYYNLTCQKCFKTFINREKLELHRCPYKCSECKDNCVHEKYLATYRKQHMDKESLFKCTDCDFTYSTKCQIICHVNAEHLNHLPYLCDLCGENFASRPQLSTHINKQHADVSQLFGNHSMTLEVPFVSSVSSERPYKCDFCEFSFNTEESYTTHRNKHLSEETKCLICEKSFSNIGQLNIHKKRKHQGEFRNRNIIFRCTMCTLDFKLKSDLLSHITTHPHGASHICRECKQSFHSKKHYISHVRKHRIRYSKTCPICLKKYTKNSISRHIKMHNLKDKDTTVCDVCAEVLPDEKALIKHAKKHNEQRQCPHCKTSINSVLYSKHIGTHTYDKHVVKSCSECNYKTKFSICLEAHINRYHLKIRPYKCEICSKTFYTSYTLKGHIETHKNERPEHYCHICGKRFISKKALLFHTRIHTGEQPYPCDLCELSFLSSSRRRQHMVRKHTEPQFECQICFKKLYTQSDLRRHMGDCHDGESKRKKPKKSESVDIEKQKIVLPNACV